MNWPTFLQLRLESEGFQSVRTRRNERRGDSVLLRGPSRLIDRRSRHFDAKFLHPKLIDNATLRRLGNTYSMRGRVKVEGCALFACRSIYYADVKIVKK